MKNILISFFFVVFSSSLYSQKVICSLPFNDFNAKGEYILLSNGADTLLAVFTDKQDKLKCVLFDKQFRLLTQQIIPFPQIENYTIVNGYYSKGRFNLVLCRGNKYTVLSIDPKRFGMRILKYTMKDKNELFLESVTVGSKIYLLTIMKKQSLVNIYEISDTAAFVKRQEFNFDQYHFCESDDNYRLYDVLYFRQKGIVKVENNSCNNFLSATQLGKLFYDTNFIYITTDFYFDKTTIISINFHDFSSKVQEYKIRQPIVGFFSQDIAENSYLCENFLFQCISTKDTMIYCVTDIQTNRQIDYQTVTKDKEIRFKSSPLKRMNYTLYNGLSDDGEVDNTEKFLWFLSGSKLFILPRIEDALMEVKIGGVLDESKRAPIAASLMMAPPVAAPIIANQDDYNLYYFNTLYERSGYHAKSDYIFNSDWVLQFLFQENGKIPWLNERSWDNHIYLFYVIENENTFIVRKF